MKYKCHDCFYKTEWEDEKDKIPICERRCNISFEQAKSECLKPGVCPHKITRQEAKRYFDSFAEGE